MEGAALTATKDYLAVRRMQLRGPDTGILLLNQYGQRLTPNAVQGVFGDLNAARGPTARHLHAHMFRHAAAVHLLRSGIDVRVVQDVLGHACLNTTKVYLRLVDSRLNEDYRQAMPEIDVGLPTRPLHDMP